MRLPRMSGNAWVCTIITLILLASGAEQAIRTVRGEKAGPPEAPPPMGPQLGDAAPEFKLPDPKGKVYSLASFAGKPVVVNFFCGCSKCETVAVRWGKWLKKKPDVNMIALVTFQPQYFKEWYQKTGSNFPMVLDPGKEVAMRWDSTICPRVWVLDKSHRVVYSSPAMVEMLPPPDLEVMVKSNYGKSAPVAKKEPVAPPKSG